MAGDAITTALWWFCWLVTGLAGFVWVRKWFADWEDGGYLFAKIIGVITVSFIVMLLGIFKLAPFNTLTIILVISAVAGSGWYFLRKNKPERPEINWRLIVVEEVLFAGGLFFWTYVKAHEPSINGLEKFMDYGFIKSILSGNYFPPKDMWYAGESINYYYFGHLYTAVMTKLSGINLGYTFNLMLATLFALTFSTGWGISWHLLSGVSKKIRITVTILTAVLIALGGNLHTIYAFTKGYAGDNPPPFWKIVSDFSDKASFQAGWNTYWYPNATRFIPYTIHEFPGYSFVVSDVHGHVLGIPIVLVLIGLLIKMFENKNGKIIFIDTAGYGFIAALGFMTNALDGLIYLGLFFIIFSSRKIKSFSRQKIFRDVLLPMATMSGIFAVSISPLVLFFKPFVNGLAVNCPPLLLENKKFGPLIFESVDKCQRSPVWMMLVLWGLFIYSGIWLIKLGTTEKEGGRKNLLILWSFFCLLLIIFPEFFYFKDIYPMHFRSNTMFKLGYQVFIIMSLVTGYALAWGIQNFRKNKWWIVGITPLLFLALMYPAFSIKSYFGKITRENYKGINGLNWIAEKYPDYGLAMYWLTGQTKTGEQPVILEAQGDSYTDFNLVSTFTGMPTAAGWLVHEWLWRGGYSPIADRAELVRKVYESADINEAKSILDKFEVKYILVGSFERQKYPYLNEENIKLLSRPVFTSGTVTIYLVTQT